MSTNFRNRQASQHSFAMVPRADIPRSKYRLQQGLKTAFNAGDLIPIQCIEVMPGDHMQGQSSFYARAATPIVPVLDDAEMETFTFFVPCRILWENWDEFITGGNFTTPKLENYGVGDSDLVGGLFDYFGLPTAGQLTTPINNEINAMPFRAYNVIYNEWFRDQNLTAEAPVDYGDGPDVTSNFIVRKRAKKHDYFTSSLPWPQKGTAVSLPLGTSAPVIGTGSAPSFDSGTDIGFQLGTLTGSNNIQKTGLAATGTLNMVWNNPQLVADLSAATAATINAIRTAFQMQRLLERDARGGTRLTETIQAHFGVRPPDFRLDRPEYLGGGRIVMNTTAIAQTSATDVEGSTTPLGDLGGFTQAQGNNHRWKYAATEHGYIITLANVRTALTYQQGLHRMHTRSTRFDYPWPVFSHLGEQPVLSKEIYCDGSAADQDVFGYQERYGEYRYTPNMITGLLRSTEAGTLDIWHYAEDFASRPTLNNAFITDPSQTTFGRSTAVGEESYGQQVLLDALHTIIATRPLPTYGVPGLIDHF